MTAIIEATKKGGAQIRAQVSTQSWRSRLALSAIATASAITALGHFPGWSPEHIEITDGVGTVIAAHWEPIGDALFQWVGMAGVALAAGWNSTPKA